jgi:hypothetical protein
MFNKTRQRITEPARKVADLAILALVVAVMALLAVVAMSFGQGG